MQYCVTAVTTPRNPCAVGEGGGAAWQLECVRRAMVRSCWPAGPIGALDQRPLIARDPGAGLVHATRKAINAQPHGRKGTELLYLPLHYIMDLQRLLHLWTVVLCLQLAHVMPGLAGRAPL